MDDLKYAFYGLMDVVERSLSSVLGSLIERGREAEARYRREDPGKGATPRPGRAAERRRPPSKDEGKPRAGGKEEATDRRQELRQGILDVLARQPEGMRLRDLAEVLNVHPQALIHPSRRLVAEGRVVKEDGVYRLA